jgi:hypothetical protein
VSGDTVAAAADRRRPRRDFQLSSVLLFFKKHKSTNQAVESRYISYWLKTLYEVLILDFCSRLRCVTRDSRQEGDAILEAGQADAMAMTSSVPRAAKNPTAILTNTGVFVVPMVAVRNSSLIT